MPEIVHNIRINRIVPSSSSGKFFDFEKLNEKYDFFKITNRGPISTANSFLDRAECTPHVLSVKFCGYLSTPDDDSDDSSGSNNTAVCFIMAEKNKISRIMFTDSVSEKNVSCEHISAEKVSFNDNDSSTLLNLLLNGIPRLESEYFTGDRFFNTSGHLYILRKDEEDKMERMLVTLDISIDKNMNISANVSTFTSDLLMDKIKYNKRHPDFYSYTRYVYDDSGETMRRWKDSDDGKRQYIARSPMFSRNTYKFLDMAGSDSLLKSKAGVITEIIKRYNFCYKGISEVQLLSIQRCNKTYIDESASKSTKKVISDIIKNKIPVIGIQDLCGNEAFANGVKTVLQSLGYDEKHIQPVVPWLDSPLQCITIIPHGKEYYEEHKDEIDLYEQKKTQPAQHIVADPKDPCGYFTKNGELRKNALSTAIPACLSSLAIKTDIQDGKISMYDWRSLLLDNTVRFYRPFFTTVTTGDKKEKVFEYVVEMTIQPDGKCAFQKLYEDSLISDIFLSSLSDWCFSRDVDCMIYEGNNIYAIRKDTGLFTVPKVEDMNKLFKTVSSFRSEHYRDEGVISEVSDVGYFYLNDELYYYVGQVGKGINSNVQNACRIRKIELLSGDYSGFLNLIPSMINVFSSIGKLYPLPFPVRYILEYDDFTRHYKEPEKKKRRGKQHA